MKIKYFDDEIKLLLCKQFLILNDYKKSFLTHFIKKKLLTEEQEKQLENYLIDLFYKMGYEQDIELNEYDDNFVYGKIEDTNVTFKIIINNEEKDGITTFEGDYMYYDEHEYFIGLGGGTIDNKPFQSLFPTKIRSEYKRANKKTTRFNLNEYNEYDVITENQEKKLSCFMNGSYKSKKELNKYFINMNLDKSVIQIFKDILQVSDLTVENLNYLNIIVRKQNTNYDLSDSITFKNGKLIYLAENKDGIGYRLNKEKLNILTNKINDSEDYKIDFDDENAILIIGNNKFLIPLDILSYSVLMDYQTRVEKVSEDFSNAIGKQLRKKREGV